MRSRSICSVLTLCLLVASVRPVAAQTKSDVSPSAAPVPATQQQQTPKTEPVPVILDGKLVIEVQWGFDKATPAQRAQGISERLEKMAKDSAPPPPMTLDRTEMSVDVWAGNVLMASVFEGDAKAAGLSREALAKKWADDFSRAVTSYRNEHSRARMIERSSIVAVVLIIAIGLLWRWFR